MFHETKLTILFLLLFFSCSAQEKKSNPLSIDISSDIITPKHYIITKNNQEIVIDGIANEVSWEAAIFSDLFIDIEGVKTPKFQTKMKMLWDEKYLYIFAQMEEPHIWGDLKKRDAVIFYNNDFEVFINPSGTTYNYGEIEINALGTVWDLLLDKPYRVGGKANNHWNLDSLKSAVFIHGTLNNSSDIDSFWTVEMAIPMDGFTEIKDNQRLLPKDKEQWRINFSRVQWEHDIINGIYQRKKDADGKFLPEYNWVWSNQKVINMHEPEKWGYLQFSTENSSENIDFIEDKNLIFKQIAFALFRASRWGILKNLLKEKVGSVRKIQVKYSDKDSLEVLFYKTNFGFEYKINVPNSKEIFMINETGFLIKMP